MIVSHSPDHNAQFHVTQKANNEVPAVQVGIKLYPLPT